MAGVTDSVLIRVPILIRVVLSCASKDVAGILQPIIRRYLRSATKSWAVVSLKMVLGASHTRRLGSATESALGSSDTSWRRDFCIE